MPSSNRDFIDIQPLGTSLRLEAVRVSTLSPMPAGAKVIAEVDGHGKGADSGWVLQLPSGIYVLRTQQGFVRTLNQRKVLSALRRMLRIAGTDDDVDGSAPAPTERDNAELAMLFRDWRAKADMPASRAAQLLGMSKRTYEGIEQGRGFRYPTLLILALRAIEKENTTAATVG